MTAASQPPAQPAATPPFAFFEWMIARRYLGATRSGKGASLISIIAVVGIALAVAVLISVMSIMQGFRAKLLDQLLGVNGHVFVLSPEPIEDYEALAARLLDVPGVVEATPLIQAPVYATARGETGIFVRGVRPEDLQRIRYVTGPDHVKAGSFETFGQGRNGGDEIALGSRIAYSLGVGPGDPVTLVSGRGADTPFGPTLRKKTYRVGAIFEVGNSEYDGFIAYMPLAQAQLFFNYGDAVQQIELKVEDPDRVADYRRALAGAAPGYEIRDWRQQNRSYFNALQVERFAMRLILFLILIVAGLNIATGLIMMVKDKTGDIAILRTMGATRGAIMRIFFLSGSLIGVLGAAFGLLLGAMFVWNIDAIENFLSMLFNTDLFPAEVYYFDGVPAEMQAGEVAFVVIGALLMSFLTTLYPSWRAARLDPVEALRYE
ncbi:lipoprotein-releasing ABC transporter permease subunit [Amphiplicatus metriothermophilus]|uniref:Lipoprotein-releasing system permease protein n=1 Tax=Amphiplicatus metriothermophilus TaxID=1519374 RepID=A0A239PPA1_9PROT|nr:lipoprotein-releasing ABC transporter permease subunit [Amphiplicatus metriothermophilus]MBB5518712.1 lipoprotein-releasing system permease protein [Amphiplicatus metriothermophilus]SNT72131.1 lipoprotein-releasing system permease protein [Amphiplicatus metriothermophilus]